MPLLQTLDRQAAGRKSLQWRPSRALGQGNRLQVHSLHSAIPEAKGLFDPANDKDACGVGFIGEPRLVYLLSLPLCWPPTISMILSHPVPCKDKTAPVVTLIRSSSSSRGRRLQPYGSAHMLSSPF